MRKRTKIIATLGPATSSTKIICNLIKEGTDVFRINLSHSNVKEIKDILSVLKDASLKLKRPVATLIDLQGQKLESKVLVKKNTLYLRLKVNLYLIQI